MHTRTKELMIFFHRHSGVARFSTILQAGFHPDSLKALENEGKVERIARGLYQMTNYTYGSHPDLVIASLQAPRGVICLVSALSFYEATSEIPKYIDLAIPQGTHANRITYPPVKFYRFAPEAWESGIEEVEIEGHTIKFYCLAKTVADCFKFRNRIGVDVAREALKAAIREHNIKPTEIMYYAKICRIDRIIKPIVEAML